MQMPLQKYKWESDLYTKLNQRLELILDHEAQTYLGSLAISVNLLKGHKMIKPDKYKMLKKMTVVTERYLMAGVNGWF